MKRVNLELSDDLYARVRAAAGDVPVNRWLRRAVERALGSTHLDVPPIRREAETHMANVTITKEPLTPVRSSSQAKRDARPYPKGKR